jgi:hypothetical protein
MHGKSYKAFWYARPKPQDAKTPSLSAVLTSKLTCEKAPLTSSGSAYPYNNHFFTLIVGLVGIKPVARSGTNRAASYEDSEKQNNFSKKPKHLV